MTFSETKFLQKKLLDKYDWVLTILSKVLHSKPDHFCLKSGKKEETKFFKSNFPKIHPLDTCNSVLKDLLNTFGQTFETLNQKSKIDFNYLFPPNFVPSEFFGGHVEGMLDNFSNIPKSEIFLLKIRRWSNRNLLSSTILREKFLWTRTKQFWWPSFFCQNPAKHQLKLRIWKIFLKSFFSFKISLWTPWRPSWQSSQKNPQTSEKFSLTVRKKKKLKKISFNFFLRKYLVDSRDSDFLTLFEGVFKRKTLTFCLLNSVKMKPRFQKEVTTKVSFWERRKPVW